MKKLFTLIVLSLVLTSCGTLFGLKTPVALVGAPEDVTVKNVNTGEELKVKNMVATGTTSRNSETDYITPGVRFKPRKGTILEISSKSLNQTKTFEVGTQTEYLGLILEGVFTFGTFTLIDIATGATKKNKPRLIDCNALFNDKPQPTQKEIKQYIISHSH